MVLVAGSLPLLVGCGKQSRTDTPQFSADPETLVFSKLEVGQEVTRTIELRNLGSGVLRINDVNLEDGSSAGELALYSKVEGELVPVRESIDLAREETHLLAVRYRPTDSTGDGGRISLTTNDPDALEVVIPIQVGDTAGEINVTPRTLDFGRVEVGESVDRSFTVSNIGIADLVITRMSVEGRSDFSAVLGEAQILGDELEEPITLEPGESRDVVVTFSPESALVADSELQITSNAINARVVTVGLVANGALPCLIVSPESVDFGSGLIPDSEDAETSNIVPLSLQSCGTASLRIERFEFQGATDNFSVMDLPDVEQGEPLFQLPATDPDGVYPTEQVMLGFRPTETQAYGGQLLVHSNAPESPHLVDLFGRGTDNECPIAIPTTTEYNVPPLDIVTLDGTPSMDPGGAVEEWEWTVVSRPEGSVSQPIEAFDDIRRPADGGETDVTTTPTAFFFVDLAGRYIIELRVRDNLGQESCSPPAATIVIEAIPDKDLHVELTWSTPVDPDQSDTFGTDIDLHFRHELAMDGWARAADGYDCYFQNKTPDWGVQGEVADNPSLDIDDTNGAGPENVNLASPEVGVTYNVGAIYYRNESTFGVAGNDPRQEHVSLVTVRVFARGELLNEFANREMTELYQLWNVVSIRWCEDAGDVRRCPELIPQNELLSAGDYRSQ